MLKKYILKILVFITNLAVAALGVFFIKSQADKEKAGNIEEKTEMIPVSQEVLTAQEEISSDREQKLRDLKTSPKEEKKIDTTTTTTTTTTKKAPAPSSSSSKKSTTSTKTS